VKKKFKRTKEIILSFLEKNEPFTIEQVKEVIKKERGKMRVGPNYTVKEYIGDLEEYGAISYDKQQEAYITSLALSQIILDFLKKNEPFLINQVEEAIKKERGIVRVGPNYTVKEYIENLEKQGAIVYDRQQEAYITHENLTQ